MDMVTTLQSKIDDIWTVEELQALQSDLKGLMESGSIDAVDMAALSCAIFDRVGVLHETPVYNRPLRVWRQERGKMVTYHVEGGGSAGPKAVGARRWASSLKATDQVTRLIHESGDLKEGELAEIVLAAQNLVDWAIDNGLASE